MGTFFLSSPNVYEIVQYHNKAHYCDTSKTRVKADNVWTCSPNPQIVYDINIKNGQGLTKVTRSAKSYTGACFQAATSQ